MRERARVVAERVALVCVCAVLLVWSMVAGEPVGPTAVGGKGARRS
jgi:hypothetical protein